MGKTKPVAIVTGAGSGIGREVARQLDASGHRLILAGRRESALRETGAMLTGEWVARATDVVDAAQACAMVDECVARFGRVDVLVNNAGVAPLKPIAEHTPTVIDEVFAVNCVGPAAASARAWPIMLRQGGGRIVFTSSMASVDPFPGFYAYAASKAAVNMLARVLANEGREHAIRAFAVAPGAVETPMLRAIFGSDEIPRAETLAPEAVARVILECATGVRDAQSGETILIPAPGA